MRRKKRGGGMIRGRNSRHEKKNRGNGVKMNKNSSLEQH
jgi:hypothetical protein